MQIQVGKTPCTTRRQQEPVPCIAEVIPKCGSAKQEGRILSENAVDHESDEVVDVHAILRVSDWQAVYPD